MSGSTSPGLRRADGSIVVVRERLTIGRGDENDLKVDHDRVSRRQAIVTFESGRLYVEDLKSSNGTRVNGQLIEARVELHSGDAIGVGPEALVVELGEAAAGGRTVLAGPGATVLDGHPPAQEFVQVVGGARYDLRGPLQIGREADNAIALGGDALISAHHARIEYQGDRLIVRDLGSSNGTRVGGRRISQPTPLKNGDRIQVGKTTLVVTTRARTAATRGSSGALRVFGVAAIAAIVAGGLLLATRPQSTHQGGASRPAPTLAAAPARSEEELERDALRSVVQVLSRQMGGSGSIISADGLVLTNAHVIYRYENGRPVDAYSVVAVRLNRQHPGERPNETYAADVLKFSQTFDLALLRIHAGRGEEPDAVGGPFPAVTVGDSDSLVIGASVSVMGYPGVGGEYPTLTRGAMSGFMPDDANGIDHGWIKTDTEINHGNSGGMAVDRRGQLIGVPTQIALANDGAGGDANSGKLGLIRPINVARMFLTGYFDNKVSSSSH